MTTPTRADCRVTEGLQQIGQTWAPTVDTQSHTFTFTGGNWRDYQLRLCNVGSSTAFEQMHIYQDSDTSSGKWRQPYTGVGSPTTGKVRVFDDSGAAGGPYPGSGTIDLIAVGSGRMSVQQQLVMWGAGTEGWRPCLGEMAVPVSSITIEGAVANSFKGNSATIELWGRPK